MRASRQILQIAALGLVCACGRTDTSLATATNGVTSDFGSSSQSDGGQDAGAGDGGVASDGGMSDDGVSDGGVSDGGVSDGGVSDGGVDASDGGMSDGGHDASDGGMSDGGHDASDGGVSDGGVSDGGMSDGGMSDGGMSDGGSMSDGGMSDGGMSDGGMSDGGMSDGGVSDGGVSDGGVSDGGVSDGGVSDGGVDASTGGDTGGNKGECCEVGIGPGCEDPDVEACVCAQDPFCCNVMWDQICVDGVEGFGCGDCGGGNGCDCCQACDEPGCNDPDIEACVCEVAPFCCNLQWFDLCVFLVDLIGCGTCDGGGQPGDCCEAGTVPGCDDPGVEACVCEQDPFCCDVVWNSICVDEVDQLGCGTCAGGTTGGTDTTGGDTTGATTAGDECDACIAASCPDELAACEANPGCVCVLNCIAAGGSAGSCTNDCGLPSVPPQIPPLADCVVNNCVNGGGGVCA